MSSRSKAGPAKGETKETQARLDALLNPQQTRQGGLSGSSLPSGVDQGSRKGLRSGMPSGLNDPRQYNPLSQFGQPGQTRNSSIRSIMQSNLDRPAPSNSTLQNPLLNPRGQSRALRPTEPSSGPTRAQPQNEVQPATKTAFTNPYDVAMASRQVQYESLSPQDKQKQEEWAQEKIRSLGPCPEGFEWLRVPGGYNCGGGSHWQSDELVAEGKGGFYMLKPAIRVDPFARRQVPELGFSEGLAKFTPVFYSLRDADEWSMNNRPPMFGYSGMFNPNY